MELSILVAGQASPLRETLDALARFDFWAAKARLAEENGRDPPAEIANPAGDRDAGSPSSRPVGPRRADRQSASATATRH